MSDPTELAKIQQNELDITRNRIALILKSGANLILTTRGIDDTALKYFSEANAIACRRVAMKDMKRIARATGASIQVSMADWSGEESFETSFLGYAEEVYEETIRDDRILIIKGGRVNPACTVLLRGPNEYMCDEMSRSFHDAVSVVKRTLESNTVSLATERSFEPSLKWIFVAWCLLGCPRWRCGRGCLIYPSRQLRIPSRNQGAARRRGIRRVTSSYSQDSCGQRSERCH